MSKYMILLFNLILLVNATLYPRNYDSTNDQTAVTPRSKQEQLAPFLKTKFQSGYIKVGRNGGKVFYIIVPKDQETGKISKDPNTPWMIWLQGGPGCASDFAFAIENGPIKFNKSGKLEKNPYSWSNLGDLVYIDQPLGTGFSNAGDICNYVQTEHEIAIDMQEFLEKFLYVHTEFKGRPLSITGESYAGHYIPAIAYHIMMYPIHGLKLQGIAIGNGWVDPIKQYPSYADFAHANGILGDVGYRVAKLSLKQCVNLIEQSSIMALLQCNAATSAIIGKLNPYDIRLKCEVPPLCYDETPITNFLNDPVVQDKLGVHGPWVDCNNKVHAFLLGDFDTRLTKKIQKIIESNYRVLIYNGMEDFICNWKGTEDWITDMQWEKQEEFNSKPYEGWFANNGQAGQIKQLDNFAFLKIYNAGHMVPMDQPEAAYAMMEQFLAYNYSSKKVYRQPDIQLLQS